MADGAALRVAVDLIHVPSRVRRMRAAPLPDGVLLVLRLAAGEPEAAREAAALSDRPREELLRAAGFFIEQILLSPGADSYRVLGATRTATGAELRRNMVLLIKCLHPDAQGRDGRGVFAARVARAWDDLKTPERRAAYDEARPTAGLPAQPRKKSAGERGRSRTPVLSAQLPRLSRIHMLQGVSPLPSARAGLDGPGLLWRTLRLLFGKKG